MSVANEISSLVIWDILRVTCSDISIPFATYCITVYVGHTQYLASGGTYVCLFSMIYVYGHVYSFRELNLPYIKTYANLLLKQGVSGVYGWLSWPLTKFIIPPRCSAVFSSCIWLLNHHGLC
jgi:hypothetical protein